jgi:hypothetical protein
LRLHGEEGFPGLDWFGDSEAGDTTGDVSSSSSGSRMWTVFERQLKAGLVFSRKGIPKMIE